MQLSIGERSILASFPDEVSARHQMICFKQVTVIHKSVPLLPTAAVAVLHVPVCRL